MTPLLELWDCPPRPEQRVPIEFGESAACVRAAATHALDAGVATMDDMSGVKEVASHQFVILVLKA